MIPDEAVYAAAFAVYGSGFDGSPVKDAWLRDFRTALEAAAPLMMAEAAGALRGWYEERMNQGHATDVVITDYEQGRDVGVTEGILAAALKVEAMGAA